ncbi:hypothetical protein [Aquibacillus saliphilus]|uniref:hypothetical protein n=1 Tax=Aquibacillus saliphilus TaxID=1909422 RepID=UPI001CF0AE0B|nr:hypothetical protein [Aquibacillus saliphilus]
MLIKVQSGEFIDVCFRVLEKSDLKMYGLTRRNGWFDWASEFKKKRNYMFGMFVVGNTKDCQGIIAIQEHTENQLIHIELMEAAPSNRYDGPSRQYKYVGIHLLGFAMHYSLQRYEQFEGFVGLMAKLNHNEHYYQRLGGICANLINGRPYYFFDDKASRQLVNTYMPGGVQLCQR